VDKIESPVESLITIRSHGIVNLLFSLSHCYYDIYSDKRN